ncbi:MAG: DUF4836 family protein [Flavobacteriaceae bacterium]|nr:DUF4836 family protein [Flavobacteriaceae bacterium]
MKKIIVILSLIISLNGIAQNLESKISNNALAVATMKGDYIFNLIVRTNPSILKNFKNSSNIKNTDLGFDLNSKAYYFYQVNDTVQYHNFMVNLIDKNKFENFLSIEKQDNIEEYLGYKFLFNNKTVTVWNDKILISSTVILPYKPYDYYSLNSPPIEEEESPIEALEESEEKIKTSKDTNLKYAKVTKVIEIDESIKTLLKNNVFTILNRKMNTSIAVNKNYNAGKKKDAAAYLWVKNYSDITNSLIKFTLGTSYKEIDLNKNFFGFTEFKSNLFFKNDEIRLVSDLKISNDWKKTYRKIYKSKLNKNFYKYINQNETLAYFSFTTDTQAVLEKYPTLMSDFYGALLPKMSDEISVATELLTVILDEKAIGEVITGDMLFILNGIAEREVKYTSYTYDENYRSTKVIKTKMEVIPDFTIMIGSENKKLISKIMELAVKHNPKIAKNTLYYSYKSVPFDLFFTIKDGIVFLTNSQKQINNIVNHFPANIGKHKKILKNNMSSFYINMEKIIREVPNNLLTKEELEFLTLIQNNFKETYLTASRLKGNKLKSEYVIKTTNKEDSFKPLLFFIKNFNKYYF